MPVINEAIREFYDLDSQERYTFYILFREWLKEQLVELEKQCNEFKGFCEAIWFFTDDLNDELVVWCPFESMIELWELRPLFPYHGGYWFMPRDWRPRLKLLNRAIINLENRLYGKKTKPVSWDSKVLNDTKRGRSNNSGEVKKEGKRTSTSRLSKGVRMQAKKSRL